MSNRIKLHCVEDADTEHFKHVFSMDKEKLVKEYPNYKIYDQGEFFDMVVMNNIINDGNTFEIQDEEEEPISEKEYEKLAYEPIY